MSLQVAILGAGLMGRWHAYYAQRLGMKVTLVVDPVETRARALAKRHAAEHCASLELALAKGTFDVVQICTPSSSHFDLVSMALEAGKHVIVEKPLVPDPAQIESLLDKAQAQDLLLAPVHQFAFQEGVLGVARELRKRNSSALSVSFDFASAGAEAQGQDALNSTLIEILPHPLSILWELWPGENSTHQTWSVQNPSPGELQAQGMHGQLAVSLQISMNARPTHCHMTIHHSGGALRLDLFHGFVALDNAKVSRRAKLLAPFVRSSKTLVTAALNLLKRTLKRQPAYPGLEHLLGACYVAIESKSAGPISPDHMRYVARGCASIEEQLA